MTRAVVKFRIDGKDIVKYYIHSDGYVSGLGKDILRFLNERYITNGISLMATDKIQANGMEDLCLQFVNFQKKDAIGYMYLHQGSTKYIDYLYVIDYINSELRIDVKYFNKIIFSGSIEEYKNYVERESE